MLAVLISHSVVTVLFTCQYFIPDYKLYKVYTPDVSSLYSLKKNKNFH